MSLNWLSISVVDISLIALSIVGIWRYTVLRKQYTSLQEQYTNLQVRNDKLQEMYTNLQERNDKLHEQTERQEQEISFLKARYKELETKYHELLDKLISKL